MWVKTDKYDSPKEREHLEELLHTAEELYKYMAEDIYCYGIKPLTPENKRELDGYKHRVDRIAHALAGYEWVDQFNAECEMIKKHHHLFII